MNAGLAEPLAMGVSRIRPPSLLRGAQKHAVFNDAGVNYNGVRPRYLSQEWVVKGLGKLVYNPPLLWQ